MNAYEIFKSINNKTKFVRAAAPNFLKDDGSSYEPDSILQNWLYGESIPNKHYPEMKTMLGKFRALEIEYERKMQAL